MQPATMCVSRARPTAYVMSVMTPARAVCATGSDHTISAMSLSGFNVGAR